MKMNPEVYEEEEKKQGAADNYLEEYEFKFGEVRKDHANIPMEAGKAQILSKQDITPGMTDTEAELNKI